MNCYKCGCRLSEKDFCTSCGTDVMLYKRCLAVSNLFYNEGLERATVRDLSGAIISLRQSLKFDKNNIEARNLLGLIYFETGEVVAALSEWVISKNIRPKKNIADDYLDAVQSSPTRLESINQTIKKYNQALVYCHQDSLDLAIIQLKKVLSLNSKYVRAHQLLALLYMHGEDWEKARKTLLRAQRVDTNNTTTLRYLKEIDIQIEQTAEAMGKKGVVKSHLNVAQDSVAYQSGNETIIQPTKIRESAGVSSIVNLFIGLLIGLAIACFLILPARVQSAKADIDKSFKEVSEQLDIKTSTVSELEQRLTALQAEGAKLQEKLDTYTGTDGALMAADYLMQAAQAYIADETDTAGITTNFEKIDVEYLEQNASEPFKNLYQLLLETVGPKISKELYEAGMTAINEEKFSVAVKELERAYTFNTENGDVLYQLGNAYKGANDVENAKKTYEKVIEDYPNTQNARRAVEHLEDLNEEE